MSGFIPYALLICLATAMLVAAFTDLRRRQIDNAVNVAIALAAPVWWFAMGFSLADIGFQFALMAGTFIIACALFAAGQMGGGDVKLLTALALWFPPASFIQLVMLMAVLGGGASVVMAVFNMQCASDQRGRLALAVIAATAWVLGTSALAFALATHRPLADLGVIRAVADLQPGTWMLVVAGLCAVIVIVTGLRHIVRHQRSQVAVPYGIAIAAAALWVIGDQTLPALRIAGQTG